MQSKLTRRAILAGVPAVAAAATFAVEDDPLLALWVEYRRAEKLQDIPLMRHLEVRILTATPVSNPGAAVIARMLEHAIRYATPTEPWENDAAGTVALWLERLTGGAS